MFGLKMPIVAPGRFGVKMGKMKTSCTFYPTRSIWKMLGPFATRAAACPFSRCRYRYCRALPAHRCPRRQRQRQRVTDGTAMAPWNGPNNPELLYQSVQRLWSSDTPKYGYLHSWWLLQQCYTVKRDLPSIELAGQCDDNGVFIVHY